MTAEALGAVSAKWLAAGLSTVPADRAAAEDGVRLAYRSAGLRPPKHIVWFASPLAAARAAALLTGLSTVAPDGGVAFQLSSQGCPPVAGTAGPSVRAAVRTKPWAAARAEVHALLGPDGWAALWSACGADAWRMVNDRVAVPLRTHLRSELPAHARAVLLDAVGGQHDAGWLAAFDAVADAPAPAAEFPDYGAAVTGSGGSSGSGSGSGSGGGAALLAVQRLAGLAGVARAAGWWWPYADVAILTERPVELHRDNIGRLHAADAPAVRFRDGFGLHAWRGMPIPPDLVRRLSRLTHQEIASERNAELRRVMLEHFGYERYLREAGAHRVGEDECGVLWQLRFADDEPLTMVEVVNSTPEPDGTSRVYWLRVPPDTRTARGGVAWTFGLAEAEYRPLVET
ncbi:DUF6745 domain-containing protein [Dactylosporangium sucinum]|uniref:DUF6745 domain-containing protein n=1 Tax=Dactylosporangium sucinum TaxID=1424081 RepID=A0A917U5J7_9ACTN|nr:hypothetical protein [Dactylosporangium sucinum]GGM60116.1 hypothetical protein GCM10007977_072020 [Dactylosporangium sucinum]